MGEKKEREVNEGSQVGLMEEEQNGPAGRNKKGTEEIHTSQEEVTWAENHIMEMDERVMEERSGELLAQMDEDEIGPETKPPDPLLIKQGLGQMEGERREQAQNGQGNRTNMQSQEGPERRRDRSPKRRFP